ncbi:hypothetical protein EDD18DRAFT_1100715 [Armillaria luteobubalina]|uniref:Uncharacterized protein n=1 Tax=Armillaria luteobubalina TaxID=153913 RepID=A0AA39QIJ0_9AGAR|nr:hypothetical protein EDD18DRAFT_1100715 [Armillaria luteobubalina]
MGSSPTDAVDIDSRAPNAGNPGFYYCKDDNFEGTCTYSTTAGGVCITFALGDAWIDNISSEVKKGRDNAHEKDPAVSLSKENSSGLGEEVPHPTRCRGSRNLEFRS